MFETIFLYCTIDFGGTKSSGEDLIITKEQIEMALAENSPEAIVIRTLPNSERKNI